MAFDPGTPQPLTGSEPFTGLDATVQDFWRFAMGDLKTNNIRGYLAEYLVAKAVGAKHNRVEWDSWDVTAPDGTKIEVKAFGYLQSWIQRRLSTPSFQVNPAGVWDAETATVAKSRTFNADVYVFCVQTAQSHEAYDALDVSQWVFYVAPRAPIQARAGSRMGLAALSEICGEPVTFDELGERIRTVAQQSRTAG